MRASRGERTFGALNVVLLLGLMLLTAYPLLYVLFASLSEPSQLIATRGALLRPLGFNLDAYRLVLQNPMIAIGYRNTLLYVAGGTLLNVVMTCLGAYALSRRNVMFATPIMIFTPLLVFFICHLG